MKLPKLLLIIIAGTIASLAAQIVIPTPQSVTVQQVAPVHFTIPASDVPTFTAALFSSLASAGATVPQIPAGMKLIGITARVFPDGTGDVWAQFIKQ